MTGIRHGVGHTPVVHHKKVPQQAAPVQKTPEPAPQSLDLKKLSESSDDLLQGIDQGPTAPNVVGATTKGSGIDNHTVTPEEAAKSDGVPAVALPIGSVTLPTRVGTNFTAPPESTGVAMDPKALKSPPTNGSKMGYFGSIGGDPPVDPYAGSSATNIHGGNE